MSGGAQGRGDPRDPWRRTRVGELGDPLLPRWFALLAVAVVPVGLVVAVVALVTATPGEVPLAERRLPGESPLTTQVGALEAGDAAPESLEAPCPVVEGIHVAGAAADVPTLREGVAALCRRALDSDVVTPLRDFGAAGGVVGFAAFQRLAVDSTARVAASGRPPAILVNAEYAGADGAWIAPLIAYQAVLLGADPGSVESVLRARRAELAVCRTLGLEARTPGCRDAAALLALPDPAAALGAAGYR